MTAHLGKVRPHGSKSPSASRMITAERNDGPRLGHAFEFTFHDLSSLSLCSSCLHSEMYLSTSLMSGAMQPWEGE